MLCASGGSDDVWQIWMRILCIAQGHAYVQWSVSGSTYISIICTMIIFEGLAWIVSIDIPLRVWYISESTILHYADEQWFVLRKMYYSYGRSKSLHMQHNTKFNYKHLYFWKSTLSTWVHKLVITLKFVHYWWKIPCGSISFFSSSILWSTANPWTRTHHYIKRPKYLILRVEGSIASLRNSCVA